MAAQKSDDERLARDLQQAELGQAEAQVPRIVQGQVVQGVPADGTGLRAAVPVVVGTTAHAGLPPVAVAGVVHVPVEELVVLNYAMALTCFAALDFGMTLINVLSVFLLRPHHLQYWSLLGLLFLVGPICGLAGSRKLNRSLTFVYLVFCVLKASWMIYEAVATLFLWPVLLALVQIWITKIVCTFCIALGAVTPQRRAQILQEKAAPAHMVYW